MNIDSVNDIPDTVYKQFDCLDVLRLATVRAAELAAFESSVDVLTASALTGLQRLPIRLRRRAASHRINRLPRRFHKHHHLLKGNNNNNDNKNNSNNDNNVKNKNGSHSEFKQKLKSRRYRRRKLRLIALHARLTTTTAAVATTSTHQSSAGVVQKSKSLWLPTHIWHAKRFHMITKWGWRLPWAPTNKIFKLCHKASHNGCLLFDQSYLHCFQVYGPELLLANCLNGIFQADCQIDSLSPELTELKTPAWSCEQTGILFTATSQNVKDISRPILGPVRILWGSRNSPKENFRHIWLWLHPSISVTAWQLLQACIKAVNSTSDDRQNSLKLNDLTGYFCRLHTTGRQSHGLISDIFKQVVKDDSDVNPTDTTDNWKLWNHLSTNIREAACVPPGLVVMLSNCESFRLNRPRLKIRNKNWCTVPIKLSDNNSQAKPISDTTTKESDFILPSGKQLSWSDIQESYPSINHCSSPDQLLSTILNSASNENKLDVLLIQNSTPLLTRSSPESIGWDIILRRNFLQLMNNTDEDSLLRGSLAARDFLVACVYRGAEVGGLRDLYHWAGLGTRAGGHFYSFPDSLWPDTIAGQQSAQMVTEEKLTHFNRLPQNIRPDYTKMGISHPFTYPWSELIMQYPSGIVKPTDMTASTPTPNVLSNGLTSTTTSTANTDEAGKIAVDKNNWFVLREPALLRLVVHRMITGDNRAKLSIQQLYNYNPSLLNALILVYLKSEQRGVPQSYARIYAFYDSSREKCIHQIQSNSCRDGDDDDKKSNQQQQQMPPRYLLGYVQDGGYGQSIGRGIGLGFISLSALSNALTQTDYNNTTTGNNNNKIIKYCIQNSTSAQYYNVKLSVVV
ncbi:unnamed protein product [Trichobilharzia szidati]|nr:unnamed protein product [Trichobilharzia szidati]